jgi:hypothetical protein
MSPKDIEPELTRLGFEVGSQACMSHDGHILLSVNGSMLRYEDAYALIRGESLEDVLQRIRQRQGGIA